MARALGWMTTRVRSGRCSRTRRSARGGTARARTAPSGTRRGSAELGYAGAVDVLVNMHYKFQQSMFMTTGVFQFINSMVLPCCLQILVRTVHTVQQTVDPHRFSSWVGCQRLLLCNDSCPGCSEQKTVEFRSYSARGRCPVSGQGCCARRYSDCVRAMLGSTMDTYSAYSRWLLEVFVRFST